MTKRLTVALASLVVTLSLLAAAPAAARPYTLDELIGLARKASPSLAASERQTAQVEAQLSEAWRSWWPTGDLLSIVAPVPEIQCLNESDTARDALNCPHTNISH